MKPSQRKTGLYFGSFNPPHVGHMVIANYMLEFGNIDEIWFVVSPQNPLKDPSQLFHARNRLEMVRVALADHPKMRVCDIEFSLPMPSYTIQTLIALEEKHPDHAFCLIMGMDNLESFQRWKAWEIILQNHRLLVYPRPGSVGGSLTNHPNVQIVNAPLMEISSSFIRQALASQRDVRFFMPQTVASLILKSGWYQNKSKTK